MSSTKKPFVDVIRNAFFIALHTHACDFSAGNLLSLKKCMLFLVSICFTLSHAVAEPIDPKSVLQVAQEFVQTSPSAKKAPRKGGTTLHSDIVYIHKMPQSDRAAFYIVNVDDAFVLVSADDVAYQVLGYSFDKNFPIAADGTVHLPPHVKGFFDDLARQIEAAADAESNRALPNNGTSIRKASSRRSPSNLPEKVDPLLTTTWDQGQFYNAFCPEDGDGPDGHVVTGCIATAMAQIIKYWGSPIHGRGIHSYDSNYGTLEVNFANSSYDFNNMPDFLTAESSEGQIHAVAKLMYDCGVAVNMQYGTYGSEAFDIEARAALINYFYFSPDMSYAQKDNFGDTEWNELLCENLAANRPVLYSGQGTGGHSFVCDGYKADDYFHFNFGWGGLADGWYLTSAIEPSGDNYSSSQSAIIGIVPDNNGNVIIGQMDGTSSFTVDEPLEFFHLLGHNAYMGSDYNNPCNNTVSFISADDEKQLVVDIMEFENQSVSIYDGHNSNDWIRDLSGGNENDLSPVVSTQNGVTLNYSGQLSYAGFKFRVSQEGEYRMVSNIVTSVDNTTVHLAWTENGAATQWQIEYGFKGFKLGEGTIYNTNTNSATIENLEKFTEYDFYIRSVCGSNQYSPWKKATIMVEAPYWQDIVTSEPEGYVFNETTNTVEISTPEGLAWWSKCAWLYGAYLTADIDLGQYKWKPISWATNLNGQGHVISNAYINEDGSEVGFFDYYGGDVTDLGINNFHVKGKSNSIGALCGKLMGTVRNCYVVNSFVDGGDYTGGLIGEVNYGTVENCYVNAYVMGARWAGLLIGYSFNGEISNSYAAGRFQQRAYCYNGGIVAYADASEIKNCYSVKMPMGVIGYKGTSIIADTATIVKTDAGFALLTPTVFDEENVSDLLTALNKGVEQANDGSLNTWKADADNINEGYPVLGSKYVVQCPNVTDVVIQNVPSGGNIDVSVGWTEKGSATQWQIRYRRHDVENTPYTYVSTENNPAIIQGIPSGYVYDFSVRAIGECEHKSGWSESLSHIVDLPYWTDVVSEQPTGYVEDADGNVSISTVEGLAWLAAKVNGLHGMDPNAYDGRIVSLTADINLAGYRWNPICGFSGIFDGQGHSISNIYVNDASSNKGLFGSIYQASLLNVNMVDGIVAGAGTIGGLVGYVELCHEINNCHSSVNVNGHGSVGSLCGHIFTDAEVETLISNCSASGSVSGREKCGGLIGNINGQIYVQNCFATGEVKVTASGANAWYRGGLIGHSFYATINNCYSTGQVYVDNSAYSAKVIGCPEGTRIHYLYGQEDVNVGLGLLGNPCEDLSNATLFQHNGTTNTLVNPISIGETNYTDLVEALNAWVDANNTEGQYRHWVADTGGENGGFPVFAVLHGDANHDNKVTVTDIAVTVDLILSNGYDKCADADGNGKVTVTDIATIIDLILATPATSRQTDNQLDPQ